MTLLDALLERGVVVSRSLLKPAEVEALRDRFVALRNAGAATSRQVLYTHTVPTEPRPGLDRLLEQWFNPHTRSDAGSTGAVLERLATQLAHRLSPDLHVFQDLLLTKLAEHDALPWHQDEPFWPVDTPWSAVVWCALDPADDRRGAVELALRSHHQLGPAIDLHTGEPQLGTLGRGFDTQAFELSCPRLDPGDALIFHGRTWHRSGVNGSGEPRRAWISTWLPLEARWDPKRAPRHPRARSVRAGELVHPGGNQR
ncbi:phytanoyl-CoA dioxygenase family protein [Enhygromyxa salina]|uniref:Phytanoyl-CoA dioxygenase PhyH n=1 Tax=Enhygromyxa salina TaxID=215803 RepID=A0A2S9YR41_9BACT|nr:phytanoyl-CoA dioxygenase family protein [Enhygromyxa salina]PRQ07553.1 Phytanoyl-CoA dioxygenase PhyH [Enhygromyxa salina]